MIGFLSPGRRDGLAGNEYSWPRRSNNDVRSVTMQTFLPQAISVDQERLKARVKTILGRYPVLYHIVFRFRDGYEDRLVDADTDICIEGFPRSANSFAVGAFRQAQNDSVSIAHHNHVPAPILRAAHRGVPTLLLVRDPVEAVISYRSLQLQKQARGDGPSRASDYDSRIRSWISFHKRIRAVLDEIVVAPFGAVIDDFGEVIRTVNGRYGTKFIPFEHTEANVEAIRSRGYHALPSEQRNALKERARDQFRRGLGAGHPLVQDARTLYDVFRNHSSL